MKNFALGIKSLAIMFVFGAFVCVASPSPPEAEAATSDCLKKANSHPSLKVSGNKATAHFTIPKDCTNQKITLASYQAPNGSDGKPYDQQKLFRWVTQTYKNPGKYSLVVTVPNCFYQVDLARGNVIHNFSTGHTYAQQNRLLASAHGGKTSCEPKPKPKPPQPVKPVVVKPQEKVCTDLKASQTSQSGVIPATYQFTPNVSGPNDGSATYSYDFGDGNTNQQTIPTSTHTYNQPGTYSAVLTVTSGNKKSDTVTCNTSVVVVENETPTVTQEESRPPAEPVAKAEPAADLPDTGPGDIAAVGFVWTFMASVLFAYRGKMESIVQAVVSRLG